MESQPQNSECRINPENFHPCIFEDIKKKTRKFSIKILNLEITLKTSTHEYFMH